MERKVQKENNQIPTNSTLLDFKSNKIEIIFNWPFSTKNFADGPCGVQENLKESYTGKFS